MKTIYLLMTMAVGFIGSAAFSQNKKIDSLQALLTKAKKDTIRVKLLNELAGELRSQPKQAFALVNDALLLSRTLNYKEGLAMSHKDIGLLYEDRKEFNMSIRHLTEGLRIYSEINKTSGIATSNYLIGIVYRKLDSADKALIYFSEAKKLFEQLGDLGGVAVTCHQIASIYSLRYDYPKSLSFHFIALKARQQRADKKAMFISYNDIAGIYLNQGNYSLALNYNLAALKLGEELGDKGRIARSMNNIGNVYHGLKNYTEALEYYSKSLNLLLPSDKIMIAHTHHNIGAIHSLLNQRADALKNFEKALEIRKETNDRNGIAISTSSIGLHLRKEKSFSQAIEKFNEAAEINKQLKNWQSLAYDYGNLGETYLQLKNYDKSREFLLKSLALTKETNHKKLTEIVYRSLMTIDTLTGDYKSALSNYMFSNQYGDSLRNDKTSEEIIRLQMGYEFGKIEDSLNFQQQLTAEKLKQQTLLAEKQKQSLSLREKELALFNSQRELDELEYLKTEADLRLEQIERKEKEKQLVISEQEQSIQKSKLELQGAELLLKSKQLQSEKTQRYILFAGAAALMAIAFFIYRNFQNQRKINRLIKTSAEKENVELQLQSLRAQLNPHFMFNSLNAIQELIVTEKNELSQSYLERFALLLRTLLENANQPFVTLQKEIDFLRLYLSLENLRLPDLKYSIHIDPQIEPEKTLTPNMMLQPYIENALWHGLQNKAGEKKLELHISRQNGSLHYHVRDNGVGRKKAAEFKSQFRKGHNSKGMELLSKRFALLSKEYGKEIKTTITDIEENGTSGGTVVTISVPASLAENKKELVV